jgi:hypothetical protein
VITSGKGLGLGLDDGAAGKPADRLHKAIEDGVPPHCVSAAKRPDVRPAVLGCLAAIPNLGGIARPLVDAARATAVTGP